MKITGKQVKSELGRLSDEQCLRIPSSMATDLIRTKFIHNTDVIRHTPRRRSLSQIDGERSD